MNTIVSCNNSLKSMKSIPVIFDSRFCSAIDLQPGTSSKASEMPAALKRPRFPQPWKENHWTVGSHQQISTLNSTFPCASSPFPGRSGTFGCGSVQQTDFSAEPKGSIEPRSKPFVIPYWFVKNGILSWMMILLNIRNYILLISCYMILYG